MHAAFAPAARALAAVPGVVGAVASTAEGEVLWAERADETFPAASVIKVPLVLELLWQLAEGRLDPAERVAVGGRVDGSGVLRDLRDVDALTLRDLATLAITVSDNTATNRLIERVGRDRVNARLDALGLTRSRLRRVMYDSAAAARGAENEMTPAEAVGLLARLQSGRGLPEGPRAELLAMLERCQDESAFARDLPAGVRLLHKTGTLDRARNDAGILIAPGRPIVLAAFIRELEDQSAGGAWLGLFAWCALRAGGRDDLPATPASWRSAA